VGCGQFDVTYALLAASKLQPGLTVATEKLPEQPFEYVRTDSVPCEHADCCASCGLFWKGTQAVGKPLIPINDDEEQSGEEKEYCPKNPAGIDGVTVVQLIEVQTPFVQEQACGVQGDVE
jgi:hypothetical protein